MWLAKAQHKRGKHDQSWLILFDNPAAHTTLLSIPSPSSHPCPRRSTWFGIAQNKTRQTIPELAIPSPFSYRYLHRPTWLGTAQNKTRQTIPELAAPSFSPQLLIQVAALKLHPWILEWWIGQTGDENSPPVVVSKVQTLGYFAAAYSQETRATSILHRRIVVYTQLSRKVRR
jgi:hypothetical protein